MRGKTISVIIPAYNVEKYIRRCLDSVVNQTYEDLEIVVVNDGSTDRTGEIIREYEERFPGKVCLYEKENGGQSSARNLGIEKAAGEYIGFVDSDDFISAQMYEKLYDEAEKNGCDIVTCGYYGCEAATGLVTGYQTGYKGEFNRSIYENPLILRVNAPYPWNKLYRADLLRRAGFRFPEGMIFEDLCSVIPLFLDAQKVGRVHEKLYYYMKGRKGGTLSTFDERHAQIVDALKIVNDTFRGRGQFETFYDTLLFFNIRHIFARFDEMGRYKNEDFKQAFTARAYALLDGDFPGWRESGVYAEFQAGNGDEASGDDQDGDTVEEQDGLFADEMMKGDKKAAKKKQKAGVREGRSNAEYFEELVAGRKLEKGAVLIKCYHGNDVHGACYYIGKLLAADKEGGYTVYVAAMDTARADKFREVYDENWNIVDMKSDRYVELLATAEYIVTNRGVVEYYRKRKGQKFIFTDFMPSVLGQGREVTYGTKNMQSVQFGLAQADAILFPEEIRDEFVPLLGRYNMDEICPDKAVYIPVTDFFQQWGTCLPDREKGEIRIAYLPAVKVFPGLEDAKYYLFLSELRKKLTKLDGEIADGRKVLVCFPKAVRRKFRENIWKHIEFLPKDAEVSEVLAGCDGLVGEYGQELYVMEALGKPVCRFVTNEPDVAWSQGLAADAGQHFETFENAEQVAQWINALTAADGMDAGNTAVTSRTCREIFSQGKRNRRQRRTVVYVPECADKKEFDAFIKKYDRNSTLFFIEKRMMNQALAAWVKAWGPEIKYIVIVRSFIIRRDESRLVRFRLSTKKKLKEKRDKERYGV